MTTATAESYVHKNLDCGIEFAALPLPKRHTVSVQIRFLVGFANEPEDRLGLNHLVEQTISKGTAERTGRELSDAFDAIGVNWFSWAARESTGYHFTALPEFTERSLELHAEFLSAPTFPSDAIEVAIENHQQEIEAIDDDPQDLSGKLFNRQVYGPVLGRHVLGEPETLRTLTPEQAKAHWREFYHAGRMQVAVAGAIDVARIEDQLNALFGRLGGAGQAGRELFPYKFEPQVSHHEKDLEQQHIGICYPGAALSDPQRYVQVVTMNILSGGMSSRLFTEVREKQGLVYWVTANTEHPRGVGIVYLGASSKPERCEKTYHTLLREIDRLSEDLEDAELRRAITGIVSKIETRGDITRARCGAMAEDMFQLGEIVPAEHKVSMVQSVTTADVKDYLNRFPRDQLSVLTLGPASITT